MTTRKILSGIIAGTLVGSSLLPGITHAAIDFGGANVSQKIQESTNTSSLLRNSHNISSTKKIEKFLSWEKKVLDFMTKDYNKTVIKLKNANAKKAYAEEYISITDNVKKVFSGAKYSSDYNFASHVTKLKKEIRSYRELRKELMALGGSALNPFSISGEEAVSIENDIVDLQKTVTASLRDAIENYDKSDFKETGKMEIDTEGSFGKIHISVEKYVKLLSLLTRSQEAELVAKGDFSINMPGSYEYNETTEKYEKTKGKTVTGKFSIDGSVKVIGEDMYLSLKDYSLVTNLTGEEKESLESAMQEFVSYKGKTVKIPLSSSLKARSELNQAEVLSQLKNVLDILEKNSLLTPYKKFGDTYSLTVKNSTIESIAAVYKEKVQTSDLEKAKKQMRKKPLLYTTAGGKKTLFVRINETEATGMASLSKENGAYSFLVEVKNPTKAGESLYLLVRKDFLDAKLLASNVNVTATYKDKILEVTAEAFAQNLSIKGPLSDENTDIDFTFNGKSVGNITWKKVADTYTYDVLFEVTVSEILSKFHMNGESTITKGIFPIIAPKDFMETEKSIWHTTK